MQELYPLEAPGSTKGLPFRTSTATVDDFVYAREIPTRKPVSAFIGEVKRSQAMYDDLAARGGNPIMWKTGHSPIEAKMHEMRAGIAEK